MILILFYKGDAFMPRKRNDIEYCEGIWNKQKIQFHRVFMGYRFTEDECSALLAGKSIEVTLPVSSNRSSTVVFGKLTNQEYNGHRFVGFEQQRFTTTIPETWCGHVITPEERSMLEDRKLVAINDAASLKTGNRFSCKLGWEMREDGSMGIMPHFD